MAIQLPDLEAQLRLDIAQLRGAVQDAIGELDGIGAAGAGAGEAAGAGIGEGVLDALQAIPLVGAIPAVGAAIGAALLGGLENEVREDMLAARTGLDSATAAKVGRAAGEAYAGNFGESIEANMDTARVAIQAGLLDPEATERDTQRVIEQLQGVADIMGEEVPAVTRAAAQAIKTGMAVDAAGALDLLVKGTQAGLNVSEDLLDTLNEYGTQFRQLGLEGPEALGLMSQAVRAGARDTDIAADALKEFAIRAQDGSELTATSFAAIGLNAEEMADRIASGGPRAREALAMTFDGLRAIEDPAERSRIAVGLFGTQSEDMAAALGSMDLSTAVDQLGQVEGAAAGAISTLGDNAAGQLETAKRNILLAVDGIQGALAQAFAPEIASGAAFVTENREAVVGFLLDAANMALDLGRALVEGAAAGTAGFGSMVNTVGPAILGLIETLLEGLDSIPLVDMSQAREEFAETKAAAEEAFGNFEESTAGAAEAMRVGLIENALDPAQEKLNTLGDGMLSKAAFHDATVALANDVAAIGYAADGSELQVRMLGDGFDYTTEAGAQLDGQLRRAVESMRANLQAARDAGEGTDSLTATFQENRGELVRQLEALGFTTAAANALADQYGAVPELVSTLVVAPGLGPSTDATRTYTGALDRIPSGRSTHISTPGLQGALNGVYDLLTTLQRLPLERTTTVRYRQVIEAGGNVPGRAGGGPVWPGLGLTLVGEEGPELVAWGGKGTVIPADVTRQLLQPPRTVAPQAGAVMAAPGGGVQLALRVFIGDQELRGMVRTEVDGWAQDEARAIELGVA